MQRAQLMQVSPILSSASNEPITPNLGSLVGVRFVHLQEQAAAGTKTGIGEDDGELAKRVGIRRNVDVDMFAEEDDIFAATPPEAKQAAAQVGRVCCCAWAGGGAERAGAVPGEGGKVGQLAAWAAGGSSG